MKLKPNVMGEQNKSKLIFQELRLFKPAKPPTRAPWWGLECLPGFLHASKQHPHPVEDQKQTIPFTANKGGHCNTMILQNWHTVIVKTKLMVSLLLAQDIQDLSSSKYPLRCKQRGQGLPSIHFQAEKHFPQKKQFI